MICNIRVDSPSIGPIQVESGPGLKIEGICIYIYIYIYMYIVYIYMYVCMYVCICVCVCVQFVNKTPQIKACAKGRRGKA